MVGSVCNVQIKVHISLMLGYYLQKNLKDFVKSLFVICYFIMMYHTICPPTIHALCPIFFTKHLNTVIWVHPLQKLQSFNNASTRTKIRVHIPIQYTFHIGDYKWCMPKKDENFFFEVDFLHLTTNSFVQSFIFT